MAASIERVLLNRFGLEAIEAGLSERGRCMSDSTPREKLTLKRYIELLEAEGVVVSKPAVPCDWPIEFATDDSRQVRPGTLFVCKGRAFKREYLVSAIADGTVAYVSETDYGVDAPAIIVNDIRRTLAVVADAFYGHPSGKVKVCAFTGTKGKSTCSFYLRGILANEAKLTGCHRPALNTGIEFDDGIEAGPSKLTTPESFLLQSRIAHAAEAGAPWLVMEASSQGLKYERTGKIAFEVGAFTNIGEDHISPIEHPTLEDYFASKLKIFSQSRFAVVNLDMNKVDRVLEAASRCERTVTFSLTDERADVLALAIRNDDCGVVATVRTPRFTRDIVIPTPVKFNVSNALAAIACAEALGISEEGIVHGFEGVFVPGRMELYPSVSGKILGIVDYAHNGMSLETLLRDLRENYPERELAVVFGATGGKGVDRRTTMGIAAGKYADRIVITEDDPGPEDVEDICAEIARNVQAQGNDNWQIVTDRVAAIETAVRETVRPAVVIVTGKGEEECMLRKNGPEPCERDGSILKRTLAAYDA